MANPNIRGVGAGTEPSTSFRRDTRRIGQQVTDALKHPAACAGALILLGAFGWWFPAVVHIAPLIAGIILLTHLSDVRHRHLPLRLPKSARIKDLNSPFPGRRGFKDASGIVFLGNDWEQGNQEVWLNREDACAHSLVIGTTGAGKTEMLLGESANYLAIGGGLIYADAKAQATLTWKISAIARRVGREDDLLVISYITGNRSIKKYSAERITNSANPLASGTADSLVQIMSSLIPAPEGDNAVFGERALTFITAVLYGLVDLRDGGHIDLGVSDLRDYMPLERVEALAFDPRLTSDTAKNSLMSYLRSLPNWKPPSERMVMNARSNQPVTDADGNPKYEPISDEAGRQHGFSQMYFTRALSSLTDTYGHIFFGSIGEVDYGDVVRQRRILVIMLPALEKSPAELQNLGKINLSAIRDALSTGLGSKLEGTRRDVIDVLSAGAKIPSKIICDEYGYMAVEGFAVVAAQARSLMGGFSVTWSGQDWAGIKRGSEREADQIWANTNTKVFGRLQDQESFTRMSTAVGEAKLTQASEFRIQPGGLGGYNDTLSASIDKTSRVDFTDMQAQIEGETHILYGGKMIRARMFYPNMRDLQEHRINRFLRVGEKVATAQIALVTNVGESRAISAKPSQGAPSTPAAKPPIARVAPPPASPPAQSPRAADPPVAAPPVVQAAAPPRATDPVAPPARPPEVAAPPVMGIVDDELPEWLAPTESRWGQPPPVAEPQQPPFASRPDTDGTPSIEVPRTVRVAPPNTSFLDSIRHEDDVDEEDLLQARPASAAEPAPIPASPPVREDDSSSSHEGSADALLAAFGEHLAGFGLPSDSTTDASEVDEDHRMSFADDDDLPDSMPLHELLGAHLDQPEGKRLLNTVDNAISGHPTADARVAIAKLTNEDVAAQLQNTLAWFLEGDPAYGDAYEEPPHTDGPR